MIKKPGCARKQFLYYGRKSLASFQPCKAPDAFKQTFCLGRYRKVGEPFIS
ncbi:hypothetical protein Barb4_00729 [Bacteroidales bacterium Barb4]|nr:hypothetical protein Barb4_00729 [Bacteroidales bacterium Barb4]